VSRTIGRNLQVRRRLTIEWRLVKVYISVRQRLSHQRRTLNLEPRTLNFEKADKPPLGYPEATRGYLVANR